MHRTVTSVLLTSLVATTLIAAAPAGDTGAASVTRPEVERVAETTLPGLDRRAVLDRVEARVRERGVGGGVEAGRAVTLDVLDLVPELDSLLVDEERGERTSEVVSAPALEHVEAVGDLDGDRADDLLATRWDEEGEGLQLSALRGRDGAILWSVELPAWTFPYAVADVTGDGVVDLLEVEVNGDTTCQCEDVDHHVETSTFDVTWTFRSGADAAVIGTHHAQAETYEAHTRTTSSDLTSSEETERWELRYDGLPAWPRLVGDQDGDGAADVLVAALDADLVWQDVERTELLVLTDDRSEHTREATVTAAVVRADGMLVRDLSDRLPDGTAWVAPMAPAGSAAPSALLVDRVGDADGWYACSGPALLQTCDSSYAEDPYTLQVLEPVTFEPRWTRSAADDPDLEDAWGAYPLEGDATGDGVDDLVVGWTVWSGADGEPWAPLEGRGADVLLGADPSGHPVLLSASWEAELLDCGPFDAREVETVELVSLDGITGEVLTRIVRSDGDTCDEPETTLWPLLLADHDGDGLTDLGIIRSTDAEDDTTVYSAATGQGLVQVSGLVYPIGDVDGDGDDDINVWSWDAGRDEDVREMPGGSVLWTIADRGVAAHGGDVDGDGAADVVVHRASWEERPDGSGGTYTYRADVVRGWDGQPFWSSTPVSYEWEWQVVEGAEGA